MFFRSIINYLKCLLPTLNRLRIRGTFSWRKCMHVNDMLSEHMIKTTHLHTPQQPQPNRITHGLSYQAKIYRKLHSRFVFISQQIQLIILLHMNRIIEQIPVKNAFPIIFHSIKYIIINLFFFVIILALTICSISSHL